MKIPHPLKLLLYVFIRRAMGAATADTLFLITTIVELLHSRTNVRAREVTNAAFAITKKHDGKGTRVKTNFAKRSFTLRDNHHLVEDPRIIISIYVCTVLPRLRVVLTEIKFERIP